MLLERLYYTQASLSYKLQHNFLKTLTSSLDIIPRPAHPISRGNISPNAVSVLYRLHRAGFRACLVGGGVRDLLLGRIPKDFDVATDAQPEQIHQLFRNCRLIGRRFRLAHIHFGSEIIEVATFRTASNGESAALKHADSGRIISDNVYGNIEEDAWRRDFTINALYYDIADFSVLDYVGGMADLQAGVLRLIGDPVQRYQEDPVRMLRAVRFQTKLGLTLDAATAAPLYELGHLLRQIPPARLGDEVLKLFLGGQAQQTLELLRHYRLFGWLFPATERCLQQHQADAPSMVSAALRALDQRVADGKSVSPGFLGAALLWEPFREQERRLCAHGLEPHIAAQTAIERVIRNQTAHASLPGRGNTLREIWEMQPRLAQISGKRPLHLLTHPRFAAAYDFLILRQDGEARQLAQWWTEFASADEDARFAMTAPPPKKAKAKASKPRRSRKPRTTQNDTALPPASKV